MPKSASGKTVHEEGVHPEGASATHSAEDRRAVASAVVENVLSVVLFVTESVNVEPDTETSAEILSPGETPRLIFERGAGYISYQA